MLYFLVSQSHAPIKIQDCKCLAAAGLFMGDIMKLTGPSLLMVLGSLMLLGANGIFLVGYDGWVFFAGMVLIGLGWCAAYVAASLLVAGGWQATGDWWSGWSTN
jgi:hypothetical protein